MKKSILFYSLFLLLQICFADIPIDKNGNNITELTYFNYLPLVLGILGALGILIFMYVYKKENINR
ncbi:MAG TPA: hypothetical protein PLJ42_02655 [Chitinophagales bacterium]|jgi:hypothetical protein|nr:hypothetical protein [Chitinophagales bacterium]HQV77834.1 hypothetical protein [Chitinophagales bacterium]HQW78308.1 hypothetical protein [Chitinophagales bacterium]HRB67446.1 hypothetical protein [Chitinophagales bacterium]